MPIYQSVAILVTPPRFGNGAYVISIRFDTNPPDVLVWDWVCYAVNPCR